MNYLNVRLVKSAVAGVLAGWLLASCSSGYSLAGVEGGRVAITDVYDRKPDAEALNILKPYQQKVDLCGIYCRLRSSESYPYFLVET